MTDQEFYLSIESERIGSDRDLRRAAARGDLSRVASGIYVPSTLWKALDGDERHRLLVRAIASRHMDEQLSHDSAASLWRLPSLGAWPTRAHAAGDDDARGRSTTLLLRHTLGLDPNGVVIDGYRVTSLARTVVDIARSSSFARGVAMADQALRGDPENGRHPLSRADLEAEAGRSGAGRARRVADFADGRSANAGESLCRVQFHALGLPAAILQKEFVDRQGRIVSDFYFEEFDLAAEFDGDKKYLRSRAFQRHLSEAEIVLAEKRRENRLRRIVRDVARFDWKDAVDRRRMKAILREHRVPV
jgi:hypothetical protein